MKKISYLLLLIVMAWPLEAFVHASGRNMVDADGNPATQTTYTEDGDIDYVDSKKRRHNYFKIRTHQVVN